MRSLICLSIAVLGICMVLMPAPLMAQGVTFRSTEFKFRFVYPSDWSQKTPRGQNVRALVSAPDGASNCNIVVRRTLDLSTVSQKEINESTFSTPMSDAEWKE